MKQKKAPAQLTRALVRPTFDWGLPTVLQVVTTQLQKRQERRERKELPATESALKKERQGRLTYWQQCWLRTTS